MRRIFWGFCRTWFLMSSLHYLSSHSDFCFEFAEIFIFKKRLPAITDTGSCPLRISVMWGVANSLHHWYLESPTPRITDTESRLLNFLKEHSLYWWYGESSTPRTSDTVSRRLHVSLSRRVADSLYRWVGESPTPRITNTESRQLRVLLSRGVDVSADRWDGELLFKEKINLLSIFRTFNG